MSKAVKKGLEPRLRFPEFEDFGVWEETTLDEVAKVTTGGKDTQNKVDGGKYPFFVRSQTVERIDTYSYDGEAILTSGDGVGVGKNFHYINGKFDFHQRVYCIYEFKKDTLGKYIFHYFSEHFHKRVSKLSAKNSVDSVRRSMVTEMPIGIPKPKEQKKIADCLSSLDEVIVAQGEKVEALRNYKKGLLQQILPHEGQSTPALRFPEFKNAGRWENLPLSVISKRITEKVGDQKLTTVSITAGTGFVSQTEKFSRDISGKQYHNYIVLRAGEFSYNKGNSKRFPQGCIYKLVEFEKVAAPNAFISFKFKDDFVPDFYQPYFDNNHHGRQLQKFITSGARSDGLLNINADDFFSITFPTPKDIKEQKTIAEFYGALNKRITAETEFFENLKTLKKGLLQQLLPIVELVDDDGT